jgi:hypothetical protein
MLSSILSCLLPSLLGLVCRITPAHAGNIV